MTRQRSPLPNRRIRSNRRSGYLPCPFAPGRIDASAVQFDSLINRYSRRDGKTGLTHVRPDWLVAAGRIARGTALRLLAVPRYDSSARLVPQAIRLGPA